jgi:hypothetical protein
MLKQIWNEGYLQQRNARLSLTIVYYNKKYY